jgi:3-oxoacyl-[acyl-carrier-protein] synthase-3
MSLQILGLGCSAPALSVSNDDLSRIMDTSDEWIRSRTGIGSRYLSRGESLTDLSAAAARVALERAGVGPEELDYILCTTVQGDYITPSLACLVQRELGCTCPAYDINAACTGFLYGLDAADAYFRAGKAFKILLVSAEMMSRHLDWSDRSTCVLFGDGAGAAVLGKGENLRAIALTARGAAEPLSIPAQPNKNPYYPQAVDNKPVLAMQGGEVFKFAVTQMTADCRNVMEQAGLVAADFAKFVPHQANARIIHAAMKNLGFTQAQTAMNIERYGNTSSATVPILLSELMEAGEIKRGDLLLLAAMGGGLTSGACVIEL